MFRADIAVLHHITPRSTVVALARLVGQSGQGHGLHVVRKNSRVLARNQRKRFNSVLNWVTPLQQLTDISPHPNTVPGIPLSIVADPTPIGWTRSVKVNSLSTRTKPTSLARLVLL